MKYTLYKATSPSGKMYIGVTNNFKRRIKEHNSSPYAFGKAMRKYGKANITFEFEYYATVEEVLAREAELVSIEALASRTLYNETLGGVFSDVLRGNNPMHNPEVLNNHPSLFTTENNPWNKPEIRARASEYQNDNKKNVSIDGVIYFGVREAARQLNSYRQYIVYKLKSPNHPTWFYVS